MSITKKIDPKSGSAGHSGLEFFSVPSSQVAIVRTFEKELLPISESGSQYEFRHFSDANYVDLSKTRLHLRASVEKKVADKWVPITNDDHVAPCQSIGAAFIKQLRIQIGGVEVVDTTSLLPYLTYIKNELNYTPDYKRSELSAIGYSMDDTRLEDAENEGHVERQLICLAGRQFETYTRLDFDLANQDRFLLSNLNILFTIYPNDAAHLIKNYDADDTSQYRLKIHAIKMMVRCVEVQPSIDLAIMRALQQTPAQYSMRKLQIRSHFLSSGRTEITQNLFSSILPKRVIIALVENAAFIGNHKKNQFCFLDHGLRSISINAGGLTYPCVPINLDFDTEKGVGRLFSDLHESCALGESLSNGITMERFKAGWAFFIINLSSTWDNNTGFDLIREGNTVVQLQFSKPLKKAVDLLCIAEFDSLLQIDSNRLVLTDGHI
jgi:hypothetical protein